MKLSIFTLLFLAVSGRYQEWEEEETNEELGLEDYPESRHFG